MFLAGRVDDDMTEACDEEAERSEERRWQAGRADRFADGSLRFHPDHGVLVDTGDHTAVSGEGMVAIRVTGVHPQRSG